VSGTLRARRIVFGTERGRRRGRLNFGREQVEEPHMHGAWAFDLLLVFLAGGAALLAYRQTQLERDEGN